jgi:hypothetical protein
MTGPDHRAAPDCTGSCPLLAGPEYAYQHQNDLKRPAGSHQALAYAKVSSRFQVASFRSLASGERILALPTFQSDFAVVQSNLLPSPHRRSLFLLVPSLVLSSALSGVLAMAQAAGAEGGDWKTKLNLPPKDTRVRTEASRPGASP